MNKEPVETERIEQQIYMEEYRLTEKIEEEIYMGRDKDGISYRIGTILIF